MSRDEEMVLSGHWINCLSVWWGIRKQKGREVTYEAPVLCVCVFKAASIFLGVNNVVNIERVWLQKRSNGTFYLNGVSVQCQWSLLRPSASPFPLKLDLFAGAIEACLSSTTTVDQAGVQRGNYFLLKEWFVFKLFSRCKCSQSFLFKLCVAKILVYSSPLMSSFHSQNVEKPRAHFWSQLVPAGFFQFSKLWDASKLCDACIVQMPS